MSKFFSCSTRTLIAAGLVALATASDPVAARDAGTFSSFAGTWSGSGQMRFEGGRTERISCRAYYTPRDGGSAVSMALRCASKDNRIEMRASLSSSGGRVSGDWEERTFNAGGNATGRASGGSMTLAISGSLSGTLQVSTSGGRQSVSITTSGVSLQGVSINLSKG
jgi:hypothetical protein